MKRMAKKRTIIAAAKGRSTRGSLIVSGMRFFFLAVGRFAPPMEMLIERLLTVGFLRGAGSATFSRLFTATRIEEVVVGFLSAIDERPPLVTQHFDAPLLLGDRGIEADDLAVRTLHRVSEVCDPASLDLDLGLELLGFDLV